MKSIVSKKRRSPGAERFWREVEQYLAFWAIARDE